MQPLINLKKVTFAASIISSSLLAGDIELYGVAHISADSVNNTKNTTTVISSNSSRLGIKFSQYISEGLNVFGQYESGVDLTGDGIDDGNGGDFSGSKSLLTRTRDSFVGLSTNLGKIIAGRIGAQNQWIYDYNLFADQVGDLGNILGAGGVGPDRASRTIAYYTPKINDFDLMIAYMSPENNNDSANESALFAKANYDTGDGFKAGLGYMNLDLDTTGLNNKKEYVITTSYTSDILSFGCGYAIIQNASGNNIDRDTWFMGASFNPTTSITVKTHYSRLNDDALNSDADMYAAGVDYKLAKELTVYVAYAKTRNDSNVNYLANNWGHGKSTYGASTLGSNPSALSFGLIYGFSTNMRNF